MPTYEYRCKDCGHDLEAQQAFTDDPLTECPSCGGALKKRFGSVGISFKGSGFYKNDSRGGSSTAASSPSSSEPSTSTAGSSSGSDGASSGSGSGSGSSSSSTSSTSAA
jgi:putative FmdB family regulatory protein